MELKAMIKIRCIAVPPLDDGQLCSRTLTTIYGNINKPLPYWLLIHRYFLRFQLIFDKDDLTTLRLHYTTYTINNVVKLSWSTVNIFGIMGNIMMTVH